MVKKKRIKECGVKKGSLCVREVRRENSDSAHFAGMQLKCSKGECCHFYSLVDQEWSLSRSLPLSGSLSVSLSETPLLDHNKGEASSPICLPPSWLVWKPPNGQ